MAVDRSQQPGHTPEVAAGQSPAAAGASGDEADAEAVEAELAAMAQKRPHLAAMVATESHDVTDPTLDWCDSQVEFEFTLDLLPDGLERLRGEEASPAKLRVR